MGKQYNKVEKRSRRGKYLKRKATRAKSPTRAGARASASAS